VVVGWAQMPTEGAFEIRFGRRDRARVK
jgi:hypothetical protein